MTSTASTRFITWRALCPLVAALILVLPGCGKREASAPELDATVIARFSPNPPVTGRNALEIKVTDPSGRPVQLGTIKVEGNMNHAGMKPVFAELVEKDPGSYSGAIEFTMGGDWFLLLTANRASGGALNKKIDVPGVKGK